MFILIVNQEPLGRALAGELVARGHEVSYLDDNEEYCRQVSIELGCLVTLGETTNINMLREAGIERADVVVALQEKDIKNIMVGIFARQFSVPTILSRIRQEHYRQAYELAGIQSLFSGFEFLLNNILIAIEEPSVKRVMRLGDGRIEIASIAVTPDSPQAGRSLDTLWQRPAFPKGALILGLLTASGQAFVLPGERPALQTGDEILIIGTPDDVHRVSTLVSRNR